MDVIGEVYGLSCPWGKTNYYACCACTSVFQLKQVHRFLSHLLTDKFVHHIS